MADYNRIITNILRQYGYAIWVEVNSSLNDKSETPDVVGYELQKQGESILKNEFKTKIKRDDYVTLKQTCLLKAMEDEKIADLKPEISQILAEIDKEFEKVKAREGGQMGE